MGLLPGGRLALVPKSIKRRCRRLIRVASKGVCTDVAAITEHPRKCKGSGPSGVAPWHAGKRRGLVFALCRTVTTIRRIDAASGDG